MNVIKLLIFLYFLLFPLGQLNRLPLLLLGEEVHLYLTDLVIIGLVACWLGWKLVRKSKFTPPPLTRPIFLFLGLAFLSLIFNAPLLSGREVGIAGLYLVKWIVYAGIYFVIYDLTYGPEAKTSNLKPPFRRNLAKRATSNLLLGAGVVSAIFGLLQYLFLPDTRFLEALNWDPHYYRVIGTFLDPAFLGMILVLTLILLLTVRWKKSLYAIRYTLFAVVYIALALTYSRSSYFAYLAGMGVIAWAKKAPKFFLIILLVGALTLLILPRPAGEGGKLGRTYTIEARIRNWQQSITIACNHPLLGVGFNAYRYSQRDYGFLGEEWQVSHAGAGADSSLLFVLATTGIFGFGAYLWLWWKILKNPNLEVIASASALLVHSFFNNSLFYPWIMAWVWTLLGAFSRRET